MSITQVPPDPLDELDAQNSDEESLVQAHAEQFRQFLQANPVHRAYIDRIIRQHLETSATPDTWGRILNGLNVYAGEELATFILTCLLRANDADFLALVEKHTGDDAWSYLRGLLALYSTALGEAYTVFGENPQGWKTVNRRVFYDYLTEAWHTSFEIIKYNGDVFYLNETPSSAIVLCQAILDTLNTVPPELAPQIANREAVENLTTLFYTFVEHFAPDLLEGNDGEADAVAPPAADDDFRIF
ncbi:MAG TPA: hypothetical protein ENN99_00080 [Chloroflexi bacterium]|nr:hypothetical protein [Chloroflexota bacterium]